MQNKNKSIAFSTNFTKINNKSKHIFPTLREFSLFLALNDHGQKSLFMDAERLS